jgi:hypothetical protein
MVSDVSRCGADEEVCPLFSRTYDEARDRFLAAADGARADVETHVLHGHVGPAGGPLATDVARLGRSDADVIVLCLSGTHGAEGFAGSAAQTAWLGQDRSPTVPDGVAVVLVHAVNPFGFTSLTRTNEGGVDLNRNAMDFDAELPGNEIYSVLHPHVMEAVDEFMRAGEWSERHRRHVARVRDRLMAEVGRWEVADAIERGQFDHPGGLEYGGDRLQWSLETLFDIVRQHAALARHIAYVDWHTLLRVGDGDVVPLCFNRTGDVLYTRCARWWGDRPIDRTAIDRRWALGTAARLPRTSRYGLVMWGVQHAAAPGADVAGAVVEFGADPEPSNTDRADGDPLVLDEIEAHARASWLLAHRTDRGPEVERRRAEARAQFSPPRQSFERAAVTTSLDVMRSVIDGAAQWATDDVPPTPGALVRTDAEVSN